MTDTPRTLAQLAQQALDVQSASNLSGVALGFGRAMVDLRHLLDGGSDSIRQHPITLLWIDKLNDMTLREMSFDAYSRAFTACTDLAAGRGPVAHASLEAVASLLRHGGLYVTTEHPGCIVVPDGKERGWWFGTANGTWQGDLYIDGRVVRTLNTDVPASEPDACVVAAAIATLLESDAGLGVVVE